MPSLSRLAALALIAFLAAACTNERRENPLPGTVGVDLTPSLESFASCAEVEDAVEDALVLQMRSILEQSRAFVTDPIFVDTGGVAAPAEGPAEHTTTNAQVEGVGEADFVQNDGTRIAVVTGDQLHLARSWPPGELARTASIPIEGWPHDLFLSGGRAVVFSAVYAVRALEGDHPVCPMLGASIAADFTCGYLAQNVVKITVLDVSDLSDPAVLSEVYLPGVYVSARLLGDRVRLVTSDTLPFPDGVRLWVEVPPGASEEEIAAAVEALAAENESLIRARSLDDWLRRGTVSRPGLPDVELGHACTDFARSSGPVLPGILTISTLDVGAPALVSRTSVLAEPGVVYASPSTLYVATRHWWWWPEPGQRDATYLHAFDLTDPDRAVYVGSGVVDGTVRDQYALDEHAGALRVVTTIRERVDDGTAWGRIETAGRLSVLVRQDGALALAGETGPFGAGETVFGTRFLGTRGFVITARIIDPLFTFDLSDPAAPTVEGELAMPGFISYLHPVDDTHLLGVGMQPAEPGGPNQVKIALLDVTDLSSPVDLETLLVGEGSWSEALWDPKAFTWFGARNLLALPFVDWSEATGLVSDLRLFRVDPVLGTITLEGSLPMADVYLDDSGAPFGWWWSPFVRRGVLASDVEGAEFVYAVSDAGIRSADVARLPEWLATIQFPPYPMP